jgi:hypothetical protein
MKIVQVGWFSLVLIGLFLVACTSQQPSITPGITLPAATKTLIISTQRAASPTTQAQITNTPPLTPTATSQIEATQAITFRPTGTPMPPTPVPTLIAHSWQPNAVLVFADDQGGDGCCEQSFPPQFTVYADGRAFATHYSQVNDEDKQQILTYQFNNTEICQLLNTIDQTGFFDYDPSTYTMDMNNPPVDGTSTTYIRVNAWRSNSIILYGLSSVLRFEEEYELVENRPPFPTILPALRVTHKLLFEFPINDWEVYKPERLGLWIYSKEKTIRNSIPWPLQNYILDEMYDETPPYTFSPPSVVIRGEDAQTIYELLDNSMGAASFTDGVYRYSVFARPLLPYEAPPGIDEIYLDIPAPIFPTPSYSLSCQPSDGLFNTSN